MNSWNDKDNIDWKVIFGTKFLLFTSSRLGAHMLQTQMLNSHLHHHSASKRHNIKDRRMNKRRMIKTQEWRTHEDFFNKIYTSHFIARVRKGCSRFACERVLETEHKLHILTPLLWPSRCVFLVLLDAQPEVLGSTAGCWLSLWHLISIFSGPQTPSGVSEGPLGRMWPSLPHLVSSCLKVCWQLLWHPTQLNYIIIQRPHDRPLDLWNRMFNRHQAEITVMQFRGYSLPVHHCSGTMGLSPCPIS